MIDYSEMVREFQRKHGIAVAGWPQVPGPGALVTRLRLMMEELAELAAALHEGRVVAVADALADLLYVVHGTASTCGIPIDAVFAEVHRSNMTKLGLDAHGKGGKITKEGWSQPRLGPILFPDRAWCPNCTRELDRSRIYVAAYDGTKVCDCGLTRKELI